MAARPGTVICYICGREYGSRSISIHEPQCIKKWHAENDRLPRDQRRPPPVKPDILPSLTGGTGNDGKRFNELAWQAAQVSHHCVKGRCNSPKMCSLNMENALRWVLKVTFY